MVSYPLKEGQLSHKYAIASPVEPMNLLSKGSNESLPKYQSTIWKNGLVPPCSILLLDSSVEAYNAIWSAPEEDFPNYSKTLRDECDFKIEKLATLLSFVRLKKYSRDKLVLNNQTKKKELVSKIMEGVKIPDFEPINMSNTRTSEGLKSLCCKGLSFVPMPYNVNSREILQNLSNYKNKIRWRSFFAKRSENDESNDSNTETEHPDAPPKIKKFTRKKHPKVLFLRLRRF